MSEVVGEAVVVIRTDDSAVGTAGPDAGKKAGKGFSGGFLASLRGPALAAGIAGIAAGVSAKFVEALNFDAAGQKLQAQLGLTEEQSAAAGRVAGDLYADNYGESMADVQSSVGTVLGSIKGLRSGSEADLAAAARAAQGYADVFDVDVPTAVEAASRAINNGLAKDAPEAFDLLTRASQRVPAALRQDLFDATNEYAQFYSQIGLDGEATFANLAAGAEQGMFGIDKAGDAVKEFTIRATDMSSTSKDAYSTLGLDAETMSNRVLAGGETAAAATQKIIDRLLQIKDPAEQANTAIALFGTPLEDLGTKNIPDFLSSLSDTEGGLGRVAGATDKAVDTMTDTPLQYLTGLWRQFQGVLNDAASTALPYVIAGFDRVGNVIDRVVPIVAGALTPALQTAGDVFTTSVLPVLTRIGQAIATNVLPVLQTMGRTFTTVVLPAVVGFITYVGGRLGPILATVGGIIATQVLPLLQRFGTFLFGTVLPAVAAVVVVVAQKLKPVFDALVDVFATRVLPTVQKVIAQVQDKLIPAMLPVVTTVGKVIGFLVKLAATILGAVLPPLIRFGGFLLSKIVPAIVSVITFVFRFIGGLISFVKAVAGAIASVVQFGSRLVGFVRGGLSMVVDAVKELPGRVLALGGRLLAAGKALIGKFLDGLGAAGGFAKSFAGKVWAAVKAAINAGIRGLNDLLEFTIPIPGLPDIPVNPPDIPQLARGTRSWRGGVSWVGEEGPELVNLPRGAQVIPAQESADLAAGAGAPGVYIDKMMPHNYSEFERQMRDQGRKANLGGRRP